MEKEIKEEVNENTEEVIEECEVVEEKTKEEILEEKIITLEQQLAESKNLYFKAYADAENTKKRLEQDFAQSNKYRLQHFALEILPAIDNFERAIGTMDESDPNKKGIEMIHSQILTALNKEGVEEIDALDKPFDPNFHHAIMMEVVEGKDANIVVEVLQKGYKIKDRILRASLVKVSE